MYTKAIIKVNYTQACKYIREQRLLANVRFETNQQWKYLKVKYIIFVRLIFVYCEGYEGIDEQQNIGFTLFKKRFKHVTHAVNYM